MSNESPWAKSEKDEARSNRIKIRNMEMDAIERSDRRSMMKAAAIVTGVVLFSFAAFLGVLWAIVAVVRAAWGS